MIKKLSGMLSALLLLTACAGTSTVGKETVTIQVPTTVFVTGSPPATGDPVSTEKAESAATSGSSLPPVGSSIPFTWSTYSDEDQGIATLNTAEWTTEAPDQFSGPPKNGAYLILDVTIEATKGKVSVNPFYWEAKDIEGRTYQYGFTSGKEPGLSSGDISVGQKSRGFVAIDSPQVAVTVQLSSVGGGAVASWSVPA